MKIPELKTILIICFLPILLLGCREEKPKVSADSIPAAKAFTQMPPSVTGVEFRNQLTPTESLNMYTYRNFYNGAGVAIGDLNGDGLADVYFSGNQEDNHLYLNRGNWQFEEAAEEAGVACPDVWCTGVTLADVNADGWLDIYVCKSGSPEGKNRHNELFIHTGEVSEKGIPAFREEADKWGIADKGLSTHAAFFDYDRDGDLDCYLLNNSFRSVGGYDLRKGQRYIRDPEGGNKLYRNDGDTFTDVSEEAGILGSNIGFGLGVTIGDVNRDRWQDIFVSNDFFERDYLYLNNTDGTFTESLETYIRETSLGAMGADMADLNNDGWPEIFVTDMLPEDNQRMKTKTAFENWDKYQINLKNGYYHQFTRNTLQLNMGGAPNKKPGVYFSEIGRMAGVSATDWSWGALIFDMDNDGLKDIFVANGIFKDLTDQDYVNFYSPDKVREVLFKEKGSILDLAEAMPSVPLSNYAFHQQATASIPTFTNKSKEWGLDTPGFSHGSAYGDLDNDGDLDLVANNVNGEPFLYRNEANVKYPDHRYLAIKLKGQSPNTFALGSQVTLYRGTKSWYQELAPMRGFMSTVDARLIFGLGNTEALDSVTVRWPDGKVTKLENVKTNQILELDQHLAGESRQRNDDPGSHLFEDLSASTGVEIAHRENEFNDFNRDRLLYHMLSTEGPKICVGDVNGDRRDDVYIGGAKGQPGKLLLQQAGGTFKPTSEAVFEKDKASEDTGCEFFDADGDGDLDLYVASGGYEQPASSFALVDRLYFNRGNGRFEKSPQTLPVSQYISTGCIKPADVDGDGDMDLLAGARLRPFLYGVPVSAYLLINDGKGKFTDVTQTQAPALANSGMFTDALWTDLDNDRDQDLILVGEWMPVRVFINSNGKLEEKTEAFGLGNSKGFWNCVRAADLNKDGRMDLVVANHGRNTRFKASVDQPVIMHVNDFDGNGSAEQIISVYNQGEQYPMTLKHDMEMQLPHLKKKYLRYDSYFDQRVEDLFPPEILSRSVVQEATLTESSVFFQTENGTFSPVPLPAEAQVAPMYGLLIRDVNRDGNPDILLGGNFSRAKPETGPYQSSYGVCLLGDGKGKFNAMNANDSGFFILGEVRDIESVTIGTRETIWVARNNDKLKIFGY